jgi:peptidoglycan endopeptidase LytE
VEPTRLWVGQKIHLPAVVDSTATNESRTPSNEVADTTTSQRVYSVKPGDRLRRIAGQFGITVSAIREANALRTDRLEVGQKLKIPAKTSGRTSASATAAPTGTPNATSTATKLAEVRG